METKLLFFIFVLVFSGLIFVFRMFQTLFYRYYLHSKVIFLSVIGVFCLVFLYFLNFTDTFEEIFSFFITLFVIVSILFLIVPVLLEKRFKDNFCHYLDILVLEMKMGHTFHHSIRRAYIKCDAFMQQKVIKIIDQLDFEPSIAESENNSFANDVLKEFRIISKCKENSLKSVEFLRQKHKIRNEIRRRSGQVSSQMIFQAAIVIGIYIALMILILIWQGSVRSLPWIKLSAPLIILGVTAMYYIYRGFKWKI